MTIPYVNIPEPHVFGLPLHPFGLLVATGIVVGNIIARRRAVKMGLDPQRYESVVFWTVGMGIVLSHVLDTIFYHPELLRQHPEELVMIHHGLSSFGGFIGAALAFTIYTRRKALDPWRYADAICYGLPFGWFFGRMGCASVHDHPGRASDSFFAVAAGPAWPDGPHFDLGLIEFMLTPLLCIGVVLVGYARDKALEQVAVGEAPKSWVAKRGAIVATLSGVYAPIRFVLDFMRVGPEAGGDPRYGGLTPAQWCCFVLLGFAVWVAARHDASPERRIEQPAPAAAVAT